MKTLHYYTARYAPFWGAVVACLFLLGVYSLHASWQEPTSNPPNGNVAAPVHLGSQYQEKSGRFGVGQLTVRGDSSVTTPNDNNDIANKAYVDALSLRSTYKRVSRNQPRGHSYGVLSVACDPGWTRTGCNATCYGDEGDMDLSPGPGNTCRVDSNSYCTGSRQTLTVFAICTRVQ